MRHLVFALIGFFALATPSIAGEVAVPYDKTKFDALVRSGVPVLLHTHTWWCPTCRRQASILDDLFKNPAYDKITTVRADFDKNRNDLSAFKVTTRSVILVFKGGKEVSRLSWETDQAKIQTLVESLLKSASPAG